MTKYKVATETTRLFTGTIKAGWIESTLNDMADKGWRYCHTVTVKKRILILLSKTMYCMIFEKTE